MLRKILFTLLTIVGVSNTTIAQICQGSLGDPILNITFGSGPNPGPALSAATTNYTYISSDCPKDGQYAVRNLTQNCHDTTWFTVTDHTGDPNGYFMIVNASFEPGQFYLDTVKGLCPGSTYEFASWLINIKKPVLCYGATRIIDPNVTFRIEKTDGTLIQSYNTNDISASTPPQWRQYGFFFTTPAGVSDVVLRMVNNAPGGCGNDLGLDDITFRPCGPQITASFAGSQKTVDTLCGGVARSYTFTAQSSPGYTNPTYQWQENASGSWNDIPGATSTTYTTSFAVNTTPGTYSFRVVTAESGNISSSKCRVSSQILQVYVTDKPAITITTNSPVCEGQSLNLSASSSTAGQITWNGPDNFSASGNNATILNAQTINAGKYYATLTTNSCSWSDSVSVSVTQKPTVILNTDSARICEGDSVQLNASGAANYRWQPSNGISNPTAATVTANPSTTTTYSVIGFNNQGCSDTAEVVINVIRKPVANAGPDRAIVKGTSIQLSAMASGDSINYYWTPDYAMTGSESLNPTVAPANDTSYIFHVVCTAGCGSAEDTMRVRIFKNLIIPNAFSPNNDGINDRWMISGIDSYPEAVISLFDRYGREVFRRKNFQGWDGTTNGHSLPVASYYYVIDLKNDFPKLTGWLYLAR